MRHSIQRVRHQLARRNLTVTRTTQLSPNMLRLHLAGHALEGFTSLSPDDHIKLLIPTASGEVERRDYTPRHYDPAAGELALDFALHDGGPATDWARKACVGDSIEIGGPRGSMVVATDFDWWLLIGDETALPAIGRRIEELPAGVTVVSMVSVTAAADEQQFETAAVHQAYWAHRPLASADQPGPLHDLLSNFTPPPGDGFIWIAAEAQVARALRRYVVEVMRHPAEWLKANGYWRNGVADASEKIEA